MVWEMKEMKDRVGKVRGRSKNKHKVGDNEGMTHKAKRGKNNEKKEKEKNGWDILLTPSVLERIFYYEFRYN